MLYVNLGSSVTPNNFGCVCMGSALSICRCSVGLQDLVCMLLCQGCA